MINQTKPSTSYTNTARPNTGETWDSIVTTWDTETRTWGEIASLLDNANKPISQLASDVVSYWKFDELNGNALDVLGLNTLTLNGLTSNLVGLIGNAGDLGASNSSVSFTNSTVTQITGDFSFSTWIKLKTDTSIFQTYILFSIGGATNRIYYNYTDNVGTATFNLTNDVSGNIDVDSIVGAKLGTSLWHNFTVTYVHSTKTYKVYLDGSLINTLVSTATAINSCNPIYIGCQNDNSLFTSALIDETSLWDRVLNTTEIGALVNSGAGVTYPFSSVPSSNITNVNRPS